MHSMIWSSQFIVQHSKFACVQCSIALESAPMRACGRAGCPPLFGPADRAGHPLVLAWRGSATVSLGSPISRPFSTRVAERADAHMNQYPTIDRFDRLLHNRQPTPVALDVPPVSSGAQLEARA